MTRPKLPLALAALLLALAAGAAGAKAGEPAADEDATPAADSRCPEGIAKEVATRIQAYYDTVRDLRAEFEQSSESVLLGGGALAEPTATRGEVVFAKPGRMRWTYREPEESLLVSDGKVLWIYDVAARQASRLPVEQGWLAGAALQFLLGEGKLADSFEISAARCEEGHVELDLLPVEPASYERLGLRAAIDSGEIRDSLIVDLFGNRTRIRFSDMRVNLSPSDATFVFTPPEGVEVVDLESAP